MSEGVRNSEVRKLAGSLRAIEPGQVKQTTQKVGRDGQSGPALRTFSDWITVAGKKSELKRNGSCARVPHCRLEHGLVEKLSPVVAIEAESVNAATEDPGWEEVSLAVDCGATETVIPPDILEDVELRQRGPYKRGVEHEVANGVQIPNLGERKFRGVTAEGSMKSAAAQVCEVNTGLLSVKKVTSAGNRVVFDEEGSCIQNKMSREVTRIKEVGGMYELTMWVRRKGF